MSKNRRRRYLIDKSLQLRFTGLILFLSVVYFAGFAYVAVVVERSVSRTFVEILDRCQPGMGDLAGRFRQLDRAVLFETLGVMAILILVLTVLGVLLTHRIAGPIYRVQQVVEAIRDGRPLVPMVLRKGDELEGLAGQVNEMIASLDRARLSEIESLGRLSERARALAGRLPHGDSRDALVAIGSEIERLAREKDPRTEPGTGSPS